MNWNDFSGTLVWSLVGLVALGYYWVLQRYQIVWSTAGWNRIAILRRKHAVYHLVPRVSLVTRSWSSYGRQLIRTFTNQSRHGFCSR